MNARGLIKEMNGQVMTSRFNVKEASKLTWHRVFSLSINVSDNGNEMKNEKR